MSVVLIVVPAMFPVNLMLLLVVSAAAEVLDPRNTDQGTLGVLELGLMDGGSKPLFLSNFPTLGGDRSAH